MSGVYEKAVHKTFVDSLRSVFLVDDAFPCFGDMFKGKQTLRRFKESSRAAALYGEFRKRQLPCDIENTFRRGDIKMVERMRKCDLIVLDFHLDPDDTDNTKAIEILRRLASSRHFNTVVVYTKADKLSEVWLDIAANLRPDLTFKGFLEDHETEQAWWQTADTKKLQAPTEIAMLEFLTLGYAGVAKKSKKENRGISLREAAALQSFRDDYIFYPQDAVCTVARMIGNAVPPRLAQSFAEFSMTLLDRRAFPIVNRGR